MLITHIAESPGNILVVRDFYDVPRYVWSSVALVASSLLLADNWGSELGPTSFPSTPTLLLNFAVGKFCWALLRVTWKSVTALSLQVDSSGRMWERHSFILPSSPLPTTLLPSSPQRVWESSRRHYPTRQTWSKIKAGGDDKGQTFLPNSPLVMVGGGGDGKMEVSCAGAGRGCKVGIED